MAPKGPKGRNLGPIRRGDLPTELEGLKAATDEWITLAVAAASIFQLWKLRTRNFNFNLRLRSDNPQLKLEALIREREGD